MAPTFSTVAPFIATLLLSAAGCGDVAEECDRFSSDRDGDGHAAIACGGDDCDDNDGNRFPSNLELCDPDGHDEDCDSTTVGSRDRDLDGYIDTACCNGDFCGTDCDDLTVTTHAKAPEVCNGVDDNCNGLLDEGTTVELYFDEDGDGYGRPDINPTLQCAGTPGFSPIQGDCDDGNPQIIPGSIVCTDPEGQAPAEYDFCADNSIYVAAACKNGQICIAQPSGFGICANP